MPKQPKGQIQSRALDFLKSQRTKDFRFIKTYGDIMGTKIKHVDYIPAKLYDKGKKWFVYYSYRDPSGKMKRYRVYENINRYTNPKDKREYAEKLIFGVNFQISQVGFDPNGEQVFEVVKNWSVIQSLNYFKQKIPEMGLRKKTSDSYYSFTEMFTQALKRFHQDPINELKKITCQALLDDLTRERRWSNTTRNNALTFGRLWFSYLIEHGITEVNPFKSIKPLQEAKSQNQPFDNDSFERIKKNADTDLYRFILFLYYTGTRPNEARQLKHENIDRGRKILFIPAKLSKGKKDGFVPLSDQFLELFPLGEGLIFGTSINYYTQKFVKLKRKLNLPESYTLYSTKHTRAVHLAEDGASPYAIMQLFRHSSLEITMNYLRGLGISIGREAADKERKI